MDRIVTNDYTSVLIPGEGGLKKPMPSLRAVHFYLQDFTRASLAHPEHAWQYGVFRDCREACFALLHVHEICSS